MNPNIELSLNDIVVLKKGHPCGENKWKIIRFGADCKIQCLKCSRIVLIDRMTLKKSVKKILEKGDQNERHNENN